MEGWICLHRKILEWEWYQDTNTFRVFMHLLLNANWKDTKYMGQVVKRGSLIVKQREIGEILRLSHRQIRTAIDKLKATNVIETKTTNKYTLVTIVNYRDYQDKLIDECQTSDNQMTHKRQSNDNQTTHLDKQYNNITKKQYNKDDDKQDKSNIIDSDVGCRCGKEYLNKIDPCASGWILQKLTSWLDDLEDDLICKAIELADKNNVRRYSYVEGILKNYLSRGIKTLEQYENLEKIKQKEKEIKNGDRLEQGNKYSKTNGSTSTSYKPTAEDFRQFIQGRQK